MSTYESKIEDIELIQGDSSNIWFFGLPDGAILDSNWEAKYTIIDDFGKTPLIERTLPKNSGTGFGDKYTANTKFVFQIYPSESAILSENVKYIVGVEIKNTTIPYRSEVAQFKVKVKPSATV